MSDGFEGPPPDSDDERRQLLVSDRELKIWIVIMVAVFVATVWWLIVHAPTEQKTSGECRGIGVSTSLENSWGVARRSGSIPSLSAQSSSRSA